MTLVPNALFEAAFEVDGEWPHPPGIVFARLLESHLRQRYPSVKELDNWRDCGWVVHVSLGERQFEVYFSEYDPE